MFSLNKFMESYKYAQIPFRNRPSFLLNYESHCNDPNNKVSIDLNDFNEEMPQLIEFITNGSLSMVEQSFLQINNYIKNGEAYLYDFFISSMFLEFLNSCYLKDLWSYTIITLKSIILRWDKSILRILQSPVFLSIFRDSYTILSEKSSYINYFYYHLSERDILISGILFSTNVVKDACYQLSEFYQNRSNDLIIELPVSALTSLIVSGMNTNYDMRDLLSQFREFVSGCYDPNLFSEELFLEYSSYFSHFTPRTDIYMFIELIINNSYCSISKHFCIFTLLVLAKGSIENSYTIINDIKLSDYLEQINDTKDEELIENTVTLVGIIFYQVSMMSRPIVQEYFDFIMNAISIPNDIIQKLSAKALINIVDVDTQLSFAQDLVNAEYKDKWLSLLDQSKFSVKQCVLELLLVVSDSLKKSDLISCETMKMIVDALSDRQPSESVLIMERMKSIFEIDDGNELLVDMFINYGGKEALLAIIDDNDEKISKLANDLYDLCVESY